MIRLLTDSKTPESVRPMDGTRVAAGGWSPTSFAILFICLCFSAICSWIILDARREAWKHANVVGSTVVNAVAADLARNIETLDLSVEGVLENLRLPGLQ